MENVQAKYATSNTQVIKLFSHIWTRYSSLFNFFDTVPGSPYVCTYISFNMFYKLQNTVIRRDLQTPTVKEEIRCYSSQYSAHLSAHPNGLVVNLMELPDKRRLRRHLPNDLPTSFLVQLLYL
jgi:hypothetical protein